MIRHWWHPAAATRAADQSTSTQGQLQAPFEALTVGHPQAAAVDQLAERLLAQRTEVHDPQQKQGSPQSPQSVTADLICNQAGGTLQQKTQGSCQVQSFAGLEGSSHASRDDVQHLGSVGSQRHSTDQSNHSTQVTGAEAAEAVPQPRTEPTVETVNSGSPCKSVTSKFLNSASACWYPLQCSIDSLHVISLSHGMLVLPVSVESRGCSNIVTIQQLTTVIAAVHSCPSLNAHVAKVNCVIVGVVKVHPGIMRLVNCCSGLLAIM